MIITILAITMLVVGALGIVGSVIWGLRSVSITPNNLRGYYGKMYLGFKIIISVISIATIAAGVILLIL